MNEWHIKNKYAQQYMPMFSSYHIILLVPQWVNSSLIHTIKKKKTTIPLQRFQWVEIFTLCLIPTALCYNLCPLSSLNTDISLCDSISSSLIQSWNLSHWRHPMWSSLTYRRQSPQGFSRTLVLKVLIKQGPSRSP